MSRALPPLLVALSALALAAAGGVAAGPEATLHGRVVTADDAAHGPLVAVARWPGGGDSARVDGAGTFRLRLPPSPPDTVELRVDAPAGATRRYHPVAVGVPRESLGREQSLALLPLRWTLETGRHAGTVVEVSPERARRAPCAGCAAFWPPLDGPGEPGYPLWPTARFPLHVAFDRRHADPEGSAPDSAAFWAAAREVEAAFGTPLFRPAPFERSLTRWDRAGPDDMVLVVVDRSLATAGMTILLGRTGLVEHADLRLRSPASAAGARGRELVAHELLHVLGMGHTCAWRSVVADPNRCPQLRAPLPTAEDVAHVQLLYRVHHLQRTAGIRWGAEAAVTEGGAGVR